MKNRLLKCLSFFGFALLLTACGGGGAGGAGGGTGGGIGATPSISLSLVSVSTGSAITNIDGGAQAYAKVRALDAAGAPVQGIIVTFSVLNSTIASVIPSSATALTDSSGYASVIVQPTSTTSAGATTITVSATVGGYSLSKSLNFSTTAGSSSTLPSLSLSLVSTTSGTPISNIVGGFQAYATARALDAAGAPVPGVIIRFSVVDSGLVNIVPTAASALTDSSGYASVTVSPQSVNSGGATTLTASTSVASSALTASVNFSVSPGSATGSSPTLTLSVIDSTSGLAVTNILGGQQATAKARVLDASGTPVASAIVNFSASDTTLVDFVPTSASALTDATGYATVVVKPSSLTASGALSISAISTVNSASVSASKNISVGAAAFTLGTMTFSSNTVAAFNSVTVNVPVTNSGSPANGALPISFGSGCVTSGKATISSNGIAVSGIVTATYTNNGCTNSPDTISAQIAGTTTSAPINVLGANIGTIRFVSSVPADKSIVLRGSGGVGRNESALLTFQVVDQTNIGLPGVMVSFAATTYTGGLTLSPSTSISDANGNVTTTISSGTIPTPVRVIATATRNSQTLSGLSDGLTISTGLPMQRFMSLSASQFNIEGWDYDGVTTDITVLMADQFGNPVSDGTTVNFITAGGAIGSSALGACLTLDGGCTVRLKSQEFRPPNGRVTILAYAQGVKNFLDLDGNGLFTCNAGGWTDSNGNGRFDLDEGLCSSPYSANGTAEFVASRDDMGDPFLSVDGSGISSGGLTNSAFFKPANGDKPIPFNGTTFQATGSGSWGLTFIRRTFQVTFSGSAAFIPSPVSRVIDFSSQCTTPTSVASPFNLVFRLTDLNNNPLPAGTKVTVDSITSGSTGGVFPDTVLSTSAVGGTLHSVSVTADPVACGAQAPNGILTLLTETPKGIKTAFSFLVKYK